MPFRAIVCQKRISQDIASSTEMVDDGGLTRDILRLALRASCPTPVWGIHSATGESGPENFGLKLFATDSLRYPAIPLGCPRAVLGALAAVVPAPSRLLREARFADVKTFDQLD